MIQNTEWKDLAWLLRFWVGEYIAIHKTLCPLRRIFRQCMTKIFSKRNKYIIELTHYLNVTYGHVCTNREVINELNIKVATLNKTLMAVIGEMKFIKFTVAILTNMRMTLAQLSLGIMSLQENVNAIYEYMRFLSTRRVNPLIIPPDSLQLVLAQAKEDMKRNPRLTLPEDPNVNI